MATITVGRHREYQLPALGFAGSPVGIDVRKVVDTGLEPVITTGIAHREPGIGQIGAGLTRAPMACFTAALRRARPAARRRGLTMAAAPPEPHHRRPFLARRAAVAAPNELASVAGLGMLARGGSAVDAMVAVNAALGVVYPHMTGAGGDAFWLVHDAATGAPARPQRLRPRGRRRPTREAYAAGGAREIAPRGPRAALTVPGAVDGWAQAHARFGRLPFSDLPAPGDRPRPRRLPARGLARPVRRRVPRPARRDARHRRRLPAARRRPRRAAARSSASRGSRTRSRRSRRAAATRSTGRGRAPRSARPRPRRRGPDRRRPRRAPLATGSSPHGPPIAAAAPSRRRRTRRASPGCRSSGMLEHVDVAALAERSRGLRRRASCARPRSPSRTATAISATRVRRHPARAACSTRRTSPSAPRLLGGAGEPARRAGRAARRPATRRSAAPSTPRATPPR